MWNEKLCKTQIFARDGTVEFVGEWSRSDNMAIYGIPLAFFLYRQISRRDFSPRFHRCRKSRFCRYKLGLLRIVICSVNNTCPGDFEPIFILLDLVSNYNDFLFEVLDRSYFFVELNWIVFVVCFILTNTFYVLPYCFLSLPCSLS